MIQNRVRKVSHVGIDVLSLSAYAIARFNHGTNASSNILKDINMEAVDDKKGSQIWNEFRKMHAA